MLRAMALPALLLFHCIPVLAQQSAPASARGEELAAEERLPQFTVREYRVLGNAVLPAPAVEAAVYPFLGTHKTLDDVQAARDSLERAYRDAGYGAVFVDIPEQQVDRGIVRLRVTEGKLDRVRITGARYFSNGSIRAALPALKSGATPRLPELQAQLAALNGATADRAVVPVLKAGRAPGAVDIELKVSDTLPLHGNIEISDRYTPDTSKLRVNAALSYDNLFQRQHKLSLQYQTSPQEPNDVQALVGSYVFRAPAWKNTTFALYAVDSKTDVAALGTLAVIGNGRIFGVRAIQGFAPRQDYVHSLTFGADYKDFIEDIRLEDAQGLVTPIRYLNWSLAYAGTLSGARTSNAFNLSANFGVRGLVNDARQFADKRFKGAPNYFYLRGGWEHTHLLPWSLQVYGRLAGQMAQSPLVNNEQLAIGGADTVRGYFEASQLGDYGFNGTIELRTVWPSKPLGLRPGAAYLFAFYDAGVTAVLDPLPAQAARADLASWGLGASASGWRGLDLSLTWARAFTAAGTIQSGDKRTHLSFGYAF